ncbi:MAG: glycosyltransferase family 4 protein [Cyclobacteriaceae bacterium]
MDLIVGLRKYDVEVLVCLPKMGLFTDVLTSNNVDYIIEEFTPYCIKIPRLIDLVNIRYLFHFFRRVYKYRRFNNQCLEEVSRRIEAFKPDLLYSNTSVINIGFLVSRKLGIPHVWHLREFGRKDHKLINVYGRKRIRQQMNNSEVLIGISKSISEHYAKIYGINVKTVYNGLLKGPVVKPNIRKSDKPETIFGFMGSLSIGKNPIEAIEAFKIVQKSYPFIKLKVAGKGAELKRLKEYCFENKIENVVFLGYLKNTEDFYQNIDILLMCSKHEGLGRVTIEAMSYGKPVIGYNNAGTAEIIIQSKTGILYDGAAKSLADKMLFMHKNIDKRQEMGLSAQKDVYKRFETDSYCWEIFQLIKKSV